MLEKKTLKHFYMFVFVPSMFKTGFGSKCRIKTVIANPGPQEPVNSQSWKFIKRALTIYKVESHEWWIYFQIPLELNRWDAFVKPMRPIKVGVQLR
jgi:hypothetical protein